jgi:uncharacterized membrane protein YeaQ/YmgE (transglycosylase-associated protein family)
MTISLANLVVWIIVGALAGTAASSVMRRGGGRGRILINTIIGMIGAFIGGILFDLLDIQIGTLAAMQINAQQLLAAFIGALILIAVARALRRG